MDFPLDVRVHCTDGRYGRSTYIILNPTTEKITHLVVRERQPSRVERLVPVKLVANTAADVILLTCTKEEFSQLEPFNQTEFIYTDVPQYSDPKMTLLWPYVAPAKRTIDEKIRRIPYGELAVRRGARVRATDGQVGKVDEFLVDPESGHVTHFVLREGHLWEKKVVTIPISQVDHIEGKVVHLKVDKKSVEAMPTIPVKRRWR